MAGADGSKDETCALEKGVWGCWASVFRGLRVWGFGVEGLGFKIRVWAGLGCRGDKGLELGECRGCKPRFWDLGLGV